MNSCSYNLGPNATRFFSSCLWQRTWTLRVLEFVQGTLWQSAGWTVAGEVRCGVHFAVAWSAGQLLSSEFLW